ncbi:glycine cleavage system protein GcvH [Jeotgalibaca porci]|jgi:glycine cleavage system H protein|uniref:Glycine cleavage system H protein n=1 Tax=Jeotgalibaca porci TaxID=1868793 RepID=A0A6G7WJE7_9LACT|nr:glycine cleavage system protein GcvH [Jeotgalibaca porci]NLB99455.1 glycine cleavage system protein GcvH [Lactobacillales bacterium]QIK52393.1 glycine cleavage system protein GcvH [Jeotgalibaca porci]
MAEQKTYFTEEHEWVQVVEGNTVRIGITDHAQEQLGDIVFIDFIAELGEVAKGDDIVTVESVKSVSDVYAPVSGTITKQNEVLNDAPETINEAAMSEGWMVELELSDLEELEELMDLSAYETFVAEEDN